MKLKHILFYFIIILGSNKQVFAQDLSTYKKVSGLNSNTVYNVMQDKKGYIWVGTEAGAARYDGYKFIHYTTEEGLTNNEVFQIYQDYKGRIWFLTNGGKPAIYENGYILNANNTPWLRDIQPKKLAKGFFEDKKNSIWYFTLDTAYHIINDRVVEKLAPPQPFSQPQNIQTLSIKNDTVLLICNFGIYNTVTRNMNYFDSTKCLRTSNTSVYTQGDYVFYVSNSRLCCLSIKTNIVKVVFTIPKNEVYLQILNFNHQDTIYLSTIHRLYKFNVKTFQVIDAKIRNVHSVTDIYKDNEGNHWVTSISKGLLYKGTDNNRKLFKINPVGLPENTTSYTLNKIHHQLYLGYDDGYYAYQSNKQFLGNQLKGTLYLGKVQQFFQLKNELYCIFNRGSIIQLGTSKINFAIAAKEVAESDSFVYLAKSIGIVKTNFLFGREDVAPKRNQFYKYLTSQRTSRLLLASQDSLYAGGLLGLHLLVNEKEVPNYLSNAIITKAPITKIIKTPDHLVVFSTENMGLGIIYKDTVFNITKQNGLLTNCINTINATKAGLIWLATAKGIDKLTYNITNNKSISYTIENYNWILDKDNLNINDILQSNDTLFIATNMSAYYHLLNKTTATGYIPKIYVESLMINDSNYLHNNLLNLSYRENRFRINFIGLAYQANGNLMYRYKLQGIDTGWHYTANTFVEYPYLVPQQYKFIVEAAMPNGNFSKVPAIIEFTINNPWWKQWWFVLSIISISVVITLFVIGYFVNKIRYKHKLVNQRLELDKQIAQLEHQALRLQMNPHFIFNAIYAIQGFYASGDIVAAKQYINKLAVLVRMILQAGRSDTISLQDELNILTNYIELFALKYDGTLQYHFIVDDNINTLQVNIPPMIIQPILENALLHGIAALREEAIITIHFAREDNFLLCTVTDNGIGRKKSSQLKIGIAKESLGLDITLKRLELLYGQMPTVSIIEIKDANTALENTGTVVTLRIPIQ